MNKLTSKTISEIKHTTTTPLIHRDFLLYNPVAVRLFHEVANPLPIIDFHNHLDPSYLASNKEYENIAQMWVNNDPYKHRAMRICGVPESKITGGASDYEKFMAWSVTLSATIGNPLFHWSCMELKQVFGINDILTPENAQEIWSSCNEKIQTEEFRALDLAKRFNVELLCTSDDLTDSLIHQEVIRQPHQIDVRPSLRADTIFAFNQPEFPEWLQKLKQQTSECIDDLEGYKRAITKRLDAFDKSGCRLADQAVEPEFTFEPVEESEAANIFQKILSGTPAETIDIIRLKSNLMLFLGKEYSTRNWVMQMHIGAHRRTSNRLKKLAGTSGGFAGIGNAFNIAELCNYLNSLELEENLPQIILYNLNPNDNALFATLTGSFCEDGVPGKIQLGPAWWYNDHLEGIKQHLTSLSNYSLISQFIGMTTDSRSILSLSRHEYFRRVLCNMIGEHVERGEYPNDWNLLSKLVKDICYNNVKQKLALK